MDIDIERPTTNEDGSGIVGTDAICKEDVDSPSSSSHAEEDTNLDVSKSNVSIGDVADVNTASVDVSNKDNIRYEPQTGLEFESKEAAYYFYRQYARSVGFGITIKASRRSKQSGKFIDVKIACSRFGKKPESKTVNSRSCPKTGCTASMHIKRKPEGNWFVYSVLKEHNHEICFDDICYTTKGRSKGLGIVACQKKGLQLVLEEANVQALLESLMLLQVENPGFWYSIDMDKEKRMRNVLLIDAKGRKDYKDFCDVIIIDTHYVRNRYHIPLVPIVGINHHSQPILFGCALVEDETASTFVWFLRTWLKAVGGQTPGVILTDQDKALKKAISEVFPDASHCFCLWHVLGKIPEKLSYVTSRFGRFREEFNEFISRAWTEEEFEIGWYKMVERFELGDDEWVRSLHEDRKKWAPSYMREIFMAGLCTAERAESISSSFDNYINRETTVKEFIEHYKVFMHNRYEEEARADFETINKQSTLKSHLPFEKQMSTLYTHAIFEKFQAEVLGILACNVEKVCEGKATVTFQVNEFEQRQNFVVTWNEAESEVCCLCRAFEYRGFLCRHALIVLQTCGVPNIPSRYILKRWTRNAKTRQVTSGISNRLHCRGQRFDNICKNVVTLVEDGSLSQDTYNIAVSVLEKALKQCVGVNESDNVLYPDMPATQGISSRKEGKQERNITKTSCGKIVQKKQKVQNESKTPSVSLQDKLISPQEHSNRRPHSFEIPYVPRQNISDLEFRNANLCASHNAQQSTQGVEQLSSISSMQTVYYTDGMQHLVQMHSALTHVGDYDPQQNLHVLEQPGNIMPKNLHDNC